MIGKNVTFGQENTLSRHAVTQTDLNVNGADIIQSDFGISGD